MAHPQGAWLTNAVHGTAARLRFWANPKGPVWAAARDGGRSPALGNLPTSPCWLQRAVYYENIHA